MTKAADVPAAPGLGVSVRGDCRMDGRALGAAMMRASYRARQNVQPSRGGSLVDRQRGE